MVIETPKLLNEVGDDRDLIRPGDLVLMIVENDLAFAKLLLEAAREKGFKGLVTSLGAAALAMTREFKPDAITLDICLPDIDGWRVLDRLKNDIALRHIPVCVISTEEVSHRALGYGAISALTKPFQNKSMIDQLLDDIHGFIDHRVRNLVVLSGDPAKSDQIASLLGGDEFRVTQTSTASAALELLTRNDVDCLVLASEPPDMSTEAFVEGSDAIKARRHFP